MISNIQSVNRSDGVNRLRGRDMICFGHDWSGDPLSKTHIMRMLSRDNRILWINSIGYRTPKASARDFKRALNKIKAFTQPVKEVEHNIFVLNPVAIPAYGIPFMRVINRLLLRFQIKRAMRKLGFKRTINWVFNPTASVVAGSLSEETVVYYCVDEFTTFSDAGTRSMKDMEKRLLRLADMVVVSADRLYKSKSIYNRNTVLLRHGVDFNHFRKVFLPETRIPDDISDLPRPIIGYFGLMATDWIDLELLVKVAAHFSTGSLVLLGNVTTDLSKLKSYSNVHLLGRKTFDSLPAYSKGFDVAILPFPISEVTLNANPLKVREYLAAGLPVVSTKIPEVELLNEAIIAENHEEFIQGIELALLKPGPDRERSERMRNETWEGRVEELCNRVSTIIKNK